MKRQTKRKKRLKKKLQEARNLRKITAVLMDEKDLSKVGTIKGHRFIAGSSGMILTNENGQIKWRKP